MYVCISSSTFSSSHLHSSNSIFLSTEPAFHFLHHPNQDLLTQCSSGGASVGFGFDVCVAVADVLAGALGEVETVVGSLQPPNQPGSLQSADDVVVVSEVVVVVVDIVVNVVEDSSVLSLQPNQPGVLHVLVLVVEVDESRQPNQPGVSHVEVEVVGSFVLVVV